MPLVPKDKDFSSTMDMDYLKALEEERKKILVFERELPLSLQLVTQAIESCKEQQQQQQMMNGSEEMCSEGPVLEEFIPLRPSYSSSDEENHQKPTTTMLNGGGADQKPDWMRSVQLWNQQPEPKGDVVMKPIAVNAKRVGGAFHPFEREKAATAVVAATTPVVVSAAPASSTTENTNGGSRSGGCAEEKDKEKEKEKDEHSQRKARRCWSPELHRRFLQSLQQLGGSHSATPKQIRELMKVDGLTNDEVKSHLQKYRLHTRRPTGHAVQSSNSSSPQQPQIVLVGGIWMPPPDYTSAAAAAAAVPASAGKQAMDGNTGAQPNGIYAPVASLPSKLGPQQKQKKQQKTNRSPTGPLNSERRFDADCNSEDGERTNSGSSATSSSSQTTTASP